MPAWKFTEKTILNDAWKWWIVGFFQNRKHCRSGNSFYPWKKPFTCLDLVRPFSFPHGITIRVCAACVPWNVLLTLLPRAAALTKAGVIRPSFRRPQFICIFYRWLLLHNLLFIEVDISFPWHPISYGVDGVFVRIECFNLFFLSPSLYTFCNIECVVLAFITKHQLTPKPFLVS